jgi:cell wall-associated NlpC family hydrolase
MNFNQLLDYLKAHPLVQFCNVSNLLPLAIIFAALVPVYQTRIENAREIAALQRDVSATSDQIETANESPPDAHAKEAAENIALNRYSIAESNTAKKGVLDRRYELESGYCSRFVRQVVEGTHGTRYSYLFGASAKITANLFLASPYGYLWPREKSKLGGVIQPGDILFKRRGSGGYGHVGIYVGDIPGVGQQLVAENSSTSIGRIQGAKGYRTLKQFNSDNGIDVVGRLPLPTNYKAPAASTPAIKIPPSPRLIFGVAQNGKISYRVIAGATLRNGRWRADTAPILSALHRHAENSRFVVVVDYLKAAKITPYAYGQHLTDKRDPRTYIFIDVGGA